MAETLSATQDHSRRTIAVIDGNSLMHRAFHAIRQPMTAPDGRATNALFGFFNMFIKMVESFSPDGVICAFDKGKPQVRIDMLPQYKAQRPPMDESLHEQFPMVKDLLRALDVPVVELQGWEGDDILGTLARRGGTVEVRALVERRDQVLVARKVRKQPQLDLRVVACQEHAALRHGERRPHAVPQLGPRRDVLQVRV